MKNEEQAALQMSAEQAADLAAIQAGAAEPETAAANTAQVQEQQGAEKLGNELAGLALMIVAAISPALPTVAKIYTPEITAAACASVAAVCAKHGWLQDGVMGQWGEEITCAAILLPLALQTRMALSVDLARLGGGKKEPAGVVGGASIEPAQTVSSTGAVDQKTVIIGSPIVGG